MDIAKSNVVRSTRRQGHRESLFFVLGTEGDFLLLADGKQRRLVESAEAQAAQACGAVSRRRVDSLVAEKIRSSEKITNSELRKAIAALRGGNQDQEG